MNVNQVKEKMYKKYLAELSEMEKVTGEHHTVCFDKLVYMTKKHFGLPLQATGNDNYYVPKEFNYAQFLLDYIDYLEGK